MDAPAGASRPPLVDELDLWVTATDLDGLPLPLQFWNARADERRYASRYHFRYAPQDDADDFDADANGFLAFASRCTSSFPFAFPPMTLEHLGRFHQHVPQSDWSRFYRDYARAQPDFPQRSFSDGGILDNKPFSYATGSLVGRHALLPVDRKLIFVEPDPAVAGAGGAAARDWNALAVTQVAVLGIPRNEAIRSDIQSVIVRNRAIERVREIVRLVGNEGDERAKVRAVATEVPSAAWGAKWLSETIRDGDWGPSYGLYHRLKVRGVVDYLAELVVRAAGLDPDSDDLVAAHYLVRAWKEGGYAEEPEGAKQPENQLLLQFSHPYRWRRVAFVIQKVKQLRSRDPAVVKEVFTGCGLERHEVDRSELASIVEALMPRLSRAQEVLYGADRELAARDGPLAAALATLGVGRAELNAILDGRSDAEMKAAAEALLGRVSAEAFAAATKVVESVLGLATAEAARLVTEALGEHVSKRKPPGPEAPLADAVAYALRFYYDAFEAYDLLLFPLEYGTQLGETNPVEIIRISPRDANRRSEVPAEARALRGASIGHFGAFFDLEWRKHDMLWGRLNAAECLIGALVPPDQAGPLIDEAHEIIAREFFDAEQPGSTGTGLDRLRRYDPPVCPGKPATLTVLDRAAAVTGEVVDGILGRDGDGAARRIATAWSALRAAMRPNPGGRRAVAKVFRVLFRSRAFRLLVLFWAALVATGIGLIAAGPSTRAAGAVLAGIFLFFGAVAVAAVWLAVAKVRKAIESRVGRFVFGDSP
jgi:patatin-related protein